MEITANQEQKHFTEAMRVLTREYFTVTITETNSLTGRKAEFSLNNMQKCTTLIT